MRDSNYKSVSTNKAAVTITTSLYDRRALDVTSDKPLVNSLNYLTYLVSSLAKVRETLSSDGGIERLIEILHECHNSTFNINDTIFNGERKLLTAWKWTLAFQCLVLIGTRGTEEIRQKVVKAGILPIIATVLDNYLTFHERNFMNAKFGNNNETIDTNCIVSSQTETPIDEESSNQSPNLEFNNVQFPMNVATAIIEATTISCSNNKSYFNSDRTNNLTSDDYDNLSVDQLFKLIKFDKSSKNSKSTVENEIRKKYIIVNIIKKLTKEKQHDLIDDRFQNDCDYEMDNNLQFLSDLYLQDIETNNKLINSKIAVRNFTETGVVIPRDDDIVWSLQLLAYISKYPYLKETLQNTHLVIDMSIRDKKLKLYLEKQMKLSWKKNLETIPKQRPTLIPKSRKNIINHRNNLIDNNTNKKINDYNNNHHHNDDNNHNDSTNNNNSLHYNNNSSSQRFVSSSSSSPQMLADMNTIHKDHFVLAEDNFQLRDSAHQQVLDSNQDIEEEESDEVDELDDSDSISNETIENKPLDNSLLEQEIKTSCDSYLNQLYDSIIDCESIVDELSRNIALCQVNEKIERYIDVESRNLVGTIIKKHRQTKEYLTKKWNYDDYRHFDVDDVNIDQDDSLIEYKKVNLFPIVEKFTFLTGTDMYYWSGVIMRNSCRRNESKGGVRQCGNLECGKWEQFPREFLKCRRCKRTKYCSRECQIRAWHCHRNWCIPSNASSSTTATSTQTEIIGDSISRTNTTLQPDENEQSELA